MFIIWIFLSILILFIIVETTISMWINSGIEKENRMRKGSLIHIQKKL